jgi:hypothetical protein
VEVHAVQHVRSPYQPCSSRTSRKRVVMVY